MLKVWLAVLAGVVFASAASAQVPSDPLRGERISDVAVVLNPPPVDPQVARNLEGTIRRAFRVYPGDPYERAHIDFGLSRVKAVAGVTGASARVEFADLAGLRMVVDVTTGPAPRPATLAQRVRLIDDGEKLVKLQLSLKGALPVSGNQWFGNGPQLTEFSPYGRYTAGTGPNTAYDAVPKVGISAIVPLIRGDRPVYVYGNVTYMAPAIAGQANGTSTAKVAHGFEDAYGGLVGGGITRAGTVWQYNVSFGMQPFCIGGAMLLCQIASSSGERAGDFTWPRWSGQEFLKAQFRVNNLTTEGFTFKPNDEPTTNTRLAGVNVNYDRGFGFTFGGTWLTALDSTLGYYLTDGTVLTRDGLRAWQLRGGYAPARGTAGPIAKLEVARQTNRNFKMAANGLGAEAGWWFGRAKWGPTITYRFTRTTGDNPDTPVFERWDLLYSGGDIDTWVQGQVMKNIHYNSNVEMHRVLARARIKPTWRLVGSFSTFRANTLNNLGGVIPTFADHPIGDELLIVSETNVSRNLYLRFTQGTLWAGPGVKGVLASPYAGPWLVGVASLSLDF
jgi:hypothetical protein